MGEAEHLPEERLIAWSFSRLLDFEKCPAMAFDKYVSKRPEPATINRTHADRGTAVHKAAEAYVQGEAQELDPLLAKFSESIEEFKELYAAGKVEIEQEWAFNLNWEPTDWFAKDTWVRIKLDVFVHHSETFGEVVDYKTGKRFGNEVKHSQQGLLYAIAAFLRYSELERVRIRFLYTDEGKESPPREYDRATVMRVLPSWDDRGRKFSFAKEWPHKPNAINCRFCPWSPNNGGDDSCPVGVVVPPPKGAKK